MPARSVDQSRPAASAARRWRRLALPAALAAALLAGACRANPGSAAFVGNTRISEDHVDQLVKGSMHAAGRSLGQSDLVSFRRQVTDLLVKDALVTQATNQLGVPVTSNQVQQGLAQQAQSSGGLQQFLQAQARNGVTEPELRLQERLTLGVQRIGDKLTRNIKVPQSKLRAIYQQAGGQAGTGLTFQQALPQLRRSVLQNQINSKVIGYLTKVAKNSDVQVNPRFGHFNAKQLQVVATSPNYFVAKS